MSEESIGGLMKKLLRTRKDLKFLTSLRNLRQKHQKEFNEEIVEKVSNLEGYPSGTLAVGHHECRESPYTVCILDASENGYPCIYCKLTVFDKSK